MSQEFPPQLAELRSPFAGKIENMKILSRSLTWAPSSVHCSSLSQQERKSASPVDHRMVELYVKKQSVAAGQASRSTCYSCTSLHQQNAPKNGLSRSESAAFARRKSTSAHQQSVAATPKNKNDKETTESVAGRKRVGVRKPSMSACASASASASAGAGTFHTMAMAESSCYKVLEFLFLGGVGASANAQLLCKLKIEYLLDASATDPAHMPAELRSSCPCLCSSPTAHSRVQMALEINEQTSAHAIVDCFHEVNRFIAAARASRKRVLIFSTDGRSRAPALAIQYIMAYYRISFVKAKGFLNASCPDVRLQPNLIEALDLWENSLTPKNEAIQLTPEMKNRPQSRFVW